MLYLKCNDGISNYVDKDDLQMVWFESTEFALARMSKKVNFNDTNADASFTAQYEHAYPNILRILPPKIENFLMKNSGSFHISAQNIACGIC